MGRPKANINWEECAKLIQAGCDGVQCAAFFGCDPETLYNRCKEDNKVGFSEYSAQNKSKGDALLLAKQFEAALKDKDRGMLIWLGKQRLGQKEKQEVDVKAQLGVTLIEGSSDDRDEPIPD